MLPAVSVFEGVLIAGFLGFLAVFLVTSFVRGCRGSGPKRKGRSSGFFDGGATWFTPFGGHDGGNHAFHPFDGQDAGGPVGGSDGGSSGDCGGGSDGGCGGSDGGGCGGGD